MTKKLLSPFHLRAIFFLHFEFERLVFYSGTEYAAKGFTSWRLL